MDFWRLWHSGETGITWDVAQYYSYLPAKFCNNNSFNFTNGQEYNLPLSPRGERMPKFTYGMALLYSPFFALGYKVALNQKDPTDGYSEPFSTCLHWGSIIYGLLGLLLLRNFLVKYFDEKTTTLTLAIVFLGTNLFYYIVGWGEMSHGYLFFLNSALLLTVWHWHQKVTLARSFLIGLLIGIISLIRPSEIIVASIFVFWNVNGKREMKDQMLKLWQNKWHLMLMMFIGFLIWLPQLLFWKKMTGQYFYFSYTGERFFWTDPQVINILFSFRKGWLLYSPLVILAFIGFFFMKGEEKKLRPLLIILLISNIYILSCWWNWFFGGSFGARAFVQHLSWLAIPIAASCRFLMNPGNYRSFWQYGRYLFYAFVFCGIFLNLGQTYQYVNHMIHPTSMTKETYSLIFGKYYLNSNNKSAWWGTVKEADDQKLRSGEDRDQ